MPRPRKKKTSKGAVAASAAAGTADEDTKGGGSKEQVAKTVAALVQHAEELLSMSDVEDAIETLQHALLLDPSNLGAAELLGIALVEAGRLEEATEVLKKVVAAAPLYSPQAWMYLGQIQEGQAAMKAYQNGIALLERMLKDAKSEGERKEVGDQLCSGLCALAELYLTDLSDVEELDGKTIQHAHEVQRLLSSAQHLRPDNPEPYQLMASLQFILDDKKEAAKNLLLCIDKTRACSLEEQPPFQFRSQTARLCSELGNWKLAGELVEELLAEDDRHGDLWWLMAECHLHNAEEAAAKRQQGSSGSSSGSGRQERKAREGQLEDEVDEEEEEEAKQVEEGPEELLQEAYECVKRSVKLLARAATIQLDDKFPDRCKYVFAKLEEAFGETAELAWMKGECLWAIAVASGDELEEARREELRDQATTACQHAMQLMEASPSEELRKDLIRLLRKLANQDPFEGEGDEGDDEEAPSGDDEGAGDAIAEMNLEDDEEGDEGDGEGEEGDDEMGAGGDE